LKAAFHCSSVVERVIPAGKGISNDGSLVHLPFSTIAGHGPRRHGGDFSAPRIGGRLRNDPDLKVFRFCLLFHQIPLNMLICILRRSQWFEKRRFSFLSWFSLSSVFFTFYLIRLKPVVSGAGGPSAASRAISAARPNLSEAHPARTRGPSRGRLHLHHLLHLRGRGEECLEDCSWAG